MSKTMIDDLSTEEYSYFLAYGDKDDQSNKELNKLIEKFLGDFNVGDATVVV